MRGGVKGHSDWWRSGDLGGETADQDGRWIAGSFKMADGDVVIWGGETADQEPKKKGSRAQRKKREDIS